MPCGMVPCSTPDLHGRAAKDGVSSPRSAQLSLHSLSPLPTSCPSSFSLFLSLLPFFFHLTLSPCPTFPARRVHHMYTRTHTYTHTNIHIYIHIHIYVHMSTCMHTYMHIHLHAYMHIHLHTYMHIHLHTYMHIHSYIHTYIHTYISMDSYSRKLKRK